MHVILIINLSLIYFASIILRAHNIDESFNKAKNMPNFKTNTIKRVTKKSLLIINYKIVEFFSTEKFKNFYNLKKFTQGVIVFEDKTLFK